MRERDEASDGRPTRGLHRRRVLQAAASAGLVSVAGLGSTGIARAAGGDELWRYTGNLSMGNGPTVVDGTVYVAGGTANLYAVNADTGEEKWQAEGGSDGPAVAGGVIFTAESDVNGFSDGTGNEVWEYELEDGAFSSPLIVDETVFVGGAGNYVYALDANDESEVWRFETGETLTSSPTVVNGTVFIASDRKLYAIDATDGTERWQVETSRSGYETNQSEFDPEESRVSSPTVVDGTVFVGGHDDAVYALDARDGAERWRFGTGATVTSSPTVADGTVYVGSNDANLYAIDVTEGTEAWRFETGGPVTSPPTVAGGRVFFGSFDNHVYALDASDGSEAWRFETGSRVQSAAIVVDGVVFVGSVDANLYALDAGVDGSSVDSRVLLGTHGHHHELADRVTSVMPPRFEVAIETNAPIDVGEELTVSINVTNLGDRAGTRPFDIDAQPFTTETHSPRLESGDSITTSIGFGTSAEHVGEHNFSVASAFNTANTTVVIRDPATDTPEQTTVATDTPTDAGAGQETTTGGTDDGGAGTTAETAAETPGFGIASALTGVGGYLLVRGLRDRDE